MSSTNTTLLVHLPPEVLSHICSSLIFLEVAKLYATNSRILQTKLVSRGCISSVAVSVTQALSPEARVFLRNHNSLEFLEMFTEDAAPSTFDASPKPQWFLSDEILHSVNSTSLKKLSIRPNIPLATFDRAKPDNNIFPFFKRFPHLKDLEIWNEDTAPAVNQNPARHDMEELMGTLEGLETLSLRSGTSFMSMVLPSTLTSFNFCEFGPENSPRPMIPVFQALSQKCPSLRHFSISYQQIGCTFGNSTTGSRSTAAPKERPVLVLPLETLSLSGYRSCFMEPTPVKLEMPYLHSLKCCMASEAPILLDLLSNHSLTSLSLDFEHEYHSTMTLAVAKALPPMLTSLVLGPRISFPTQMFQTDEPVYNFFELLPRNLRILKVSSRLEYCDWDLLPANLEKLQLRSYPLYNPQHLVRSLPCRNLTFFEASVNFTAESIWHLPTSLTRVSFSLCEDWEDSHVKALLLHLPRANIVLDGLVRITQSPPDDSVTVDLNELAMRQLGTDAYRRALVKWVADLSHPPAKRRKGEPTIASTSQLLRLPSSTTSFSVRLTHWEKEPSLLSLAQNSKDALPFGSDPSHYLERTKFGIVGMDGLMLALSKLAGLVSLTLSTPNPIQFKTLSDTLPSITYLDCGISGLVNFMPACLPKSLTSFTSLQKIALEARKRYKNSVSVHRAGAAANQSLARKNGQQIRFNPSPSSSSFGSGALGNEGYLSQSAQAEFDENPMSNFPPNLTHLVIPGIPLLDSEPLELPRSLKTLYLYAPEWLDYHVEVMKTRLPNLTSFTITDAFEIARVMPTRGSKD